MIYLIVGMLVTLACLIAFLWVGTYFFQGYIYTEPSEGLYWQAPAAGALMTAGFAIWCFIVASSASANLSNIPINVLHKFSAKEDLFDSLKPAPTLWAIKIDRRKKTDDKDAPILDKKGDDEEPKAIEKKVETSDPNKIEYKLVRVSQKQFRYMDTGFVPHPWNPQDVIAIEIPTADGKTMRLDKIKTEDGQNRRFRSSNGWEMVETTDGPTGNPEHFIFPRLVLNVLFNLAHLAGWFIALCLLLRLQWAHALGLAVVLWLVFTIAILPMMLGYSAEVAQKRQVAAAQQPAAQ